MSATPLEYAALLRHQELLQRQELIRRLHAQQQQQQQLQHQLQNHQVKRSGPVHYDNGSQQRLAGQGLASATKSGPSFAASAPASNVVVPSTGWVGHHPALGPVLAQSQSTEESRQYFSQQIRSANVQKSGMLGTGSGNITPSSSVTTTSGSSMSMDTLSTRSTGMQQVMGSQFHYQEPDLSPLSLHMRQMENLTIGGTAFRGSQGAVATLRVAPSDGPRPTLTMKMTTHLLDTYRRINISLRASHDELYSARAPQDSFHSPPNGVYNSGYDDEHHDYIIRIGDIIADRYVITGSLGKGGFGQVVRVFDKVEQVYSAMKIIKNKPPYYNQSLIEVKILERLQARDPEQKFCIVQKKNHFVFRNHMCLVFELLSISLYDLLKQTNFAGVSLLLIRKFAYQLLRALYFLRQKAVDVVHCDLKPENVLLENTKRSVVKLIDFGSSCRSGEQMHKYIQSRFYRAPEVLLGLGYGTPIDMWSLGLILFEMHTGEPLFPGTDECHQFALISKLKGVVPDHMIQNCPHPRKYFFMAEQATPTGGIELVWQVKGTGRVKYKSLHQLLGVEPGNVVNPRLGTEHHTEHDYELFIDLINRMTTLDPAKRITPEEAFHHEFLHGIENLRC